MEASNVHLGKHSLEVQTTTVCKEFLTFFFFFNIKQGFV